MSGLFDSVDGKPRPGYARLLSDGRVDESFAPWQGSTNSPARTYLPGGIYSDGGQSPERGPDYPANLWTFLLEPPQGPLEKCLRPAPVHGEILIKRPSGAEPSHDNRLASDSVQGWPEAVLNPRLSHPGYYRANLGALGIC